MPEVQMNTDTLSVQPVHSKIGASSMHRWSQCPGSVKLSEGIPSKTSPYAEEGTLAHNIAADWLLKKDHVVSDLPEDMLPAVKTYVDFVKSAKKEFDDCVVFIEKKLDLSKIHPNLYGTGDAGLWYPTEKLLRVIDYKHGAGIAVDAVDNEQLMYYAIGFVLELDVVPKTIEVIIVQPRCFHPDGPIRRWSFDLIKLLDFAADLKEAALATEQPNAPLKSGDHCKFCPAVYICPELKKHKDELATIEFKPHLSFDTEKLIEAYSKLDALETWIKSVRELAYEEAKHNRLPGYKLVAKRANRKWRSDHDVTKGLKELGLTAEDMYEQPSIKSPAQIEKLLDKKQKKKLEELVIAESSGLTLVHESDKRPKAIVDAADEFKTIEKGETA